MHKGSPYSVCASTACAVSTEWILFANYTCILDQWTLSNTINNTNNRSRNHFCQGFFFLQVNTLFTKVHAVSARSTVWFYAEQVKGKHNSLLKNFGIDCMPKFQTGILLAFYWKIRNH